MPASLWAQQWLNVLFECLFIYSSTQLTNTLNLIIHSNRNRSVPTLADFPWKLNENFITVLTLRSETNRVMAFVEYKKRLIRPWSALYSPFALVSWQRNYRPVCCWRDGPVNALNGQNRSKSIGAAKVSRMYGIAKPQGL